MNRRFDLLGLPRLAFDNIYQHLGFEDIILLAACSKRFQSFLRGKERFLKTSCQLHIDGYAKRNIILKDIGRLQNRRKFVLDVWTINPMQSWYVYSHIEETVRGVYWQIQRRPGDWKVYGSTLDAILYWFQFVKDLFNCYVSINISIHHHVIELVDELYETDALHVADKMILRYGQIDDHQMKHILDNVEAHELELIAYPHANFQYDKVLTRIPKIVLCRPHWLSTDHLWEMVQGGVKKMHFQKTVLWTNTEFNQFLKNWLNSTNRTLEHLIFVFEKNACVPATVLDGIETLPAAERNGRVISREDGVRATIVLHENSFYCSSFRVCYDPNRDL